jgi:hypothetical protein
VSGAAFSKQFSRQFRTFHRQTVLFKTTARDLNVTGGNLENVMVATCDLRPMLADLDV